MYPAPNPSPPSPARVLLAMIAYAIITGIEILLIIKLGKSFPLPNILIAAFTFALLGSTFLLFTRIFRRRP